MLPLLIRDEALGAETWLPGCGAWERVLKECAHRGRVEPLARPRPALDRHFLSINSALALSLSFDALIHASRVPGVVVKCPLNSLLVDMRPYVVHLVDVGVLAVEVHDDANRDPSVPDHQLAPADAGVLTDVGIHFRRFRPVPAGGCAHQIPPTMTVVGTQYPLPPLGGAGLVLRWTDHDPA